MAEKRMFSKAIVTSDAFLTMPTSSQALYFQLCMNADDDGFVNNPVVVCRMTGAEQSDLDSLKDNNFIIQFETGVAVIKHWRINNTIRGDRKKETNYKEEMGRLTVKENGAYTLCQPTDNQLTTKRQPSDRQVADNCQTNDRIDKNSIDKNSIEEVSILPPKGGAGGNEKTKLKTRFCEMIAESDFSDVLKVKLNDWLEYKYEIKKGYTSERGFKQFLGTVAGYTLKFTDEEIIGAINQSMSNNYQGIVWAYLDDKKPKGSAYMDAINSRVGVVDEWV